MPDHAPVDIREAVARIRAWGEERSWRGYDPYDGLNSPLAPLLSLGTGFGRRALTQAVKLSPVNLRPLLGIEPAWNAKAIALVASGYARLSAAEGDEGGRAAAAGWLDWLVAHHAGGAPGLAWGYHFPVETRVFAYPRNAPNTIATSFAAQALLDGSEFLGEPRFAEAAESAAAFLVGEMLADGPGGSYFRYLRGQDKLIHNANLLACAVLARAAAVTGATALREPAARALAATLAAQRDDGSWPYSGTSGQDWVDNFHTGYVLESLAQCEDLLPDAPLRLERGVAYWERALFLPDGTPKYFPDRVLPIDAHCYAQAIETWLAVRGRHPHALERAARQAQLLVERMLDPGGWMHFQRRRFWTSRVPLVRWTTAPAFRALARLLLAQREGEGAGRPDPVGQSRTHLD